MDILGFLSFEMVRGLCVAALDIRNAAAGIDPAQVLVFGGTKQPQKQDEEKIPEETQEESKQQQQQPEEVDDTTRKQGMSSREVSSEDAHVVAPVDTAEAKSKDETEQKSEEDLTLSTAAENTTIIVTGADAPKQAEEISAEEDQSTKVKPIEFDERPSERTERETAIAALNLKYPLQPDHILAAYSRIQRDSARRRSGGIRNWQGGARRNRIALI